MTEITIDRPGCFGSVIMCKPERPRCAACMFGTDCAAATDTARSRLAPLIARVAGAKRPRPMPKKPKVAPAVAAPTPLPPPKVEAPVIVIPTVVALPPALESLAKKPREKIELWTKRGVAFEDFFRNINPFESQQKFIRVFADVMLAERTITRTNMIGRMRDRLRTEDGSPWSDASLVSHYNIASDALAALGLIEKTATELRVATKENA